MSVCSKKCAQEFISTLDDRQDLRKNLKSQAEVATVKILKAKFSNLIEIGITLNDLCLFVTHQLIRIYTYCDTTLLGLGNPSRPHVLRHNALNPQRPIFLEFKSAATEFVAPCCDSEEERNFFDVRFSYEFQKGQSISWPLEGVLNVIVIEDEEYLTYNLSYHQPRGQDYTSREKLTLGQLASTGEWLVEQISANPRITLAQLEFVSPDSGKMPGFGSVSGSVTSVETMATLFQSVVDRLPNKIGLIVGDKKFTYAEINRRAEQIARVIQATRTGVEAPPKIIALCLDRTELIIFAIFAVWKIGAAYVPIDPNYPSGRIELILKDCQPFMVLTDAQSKSKLLPLTCSQIDISADLQNMKVNDRQMINAEVNDLALVVYTSGTTGHPKGVMIRHYSLVHQCRDYRDRYPDLTSEEVVVQLLNYAFNAFLEPVTLAISTGLTLVMVPFKLLMEPKSLLDYMVQCGVTHIDGTPSLATQFNLSRLTGLKRVAVGGEPLTQGHRATFLKNNPDIKIYNIYGNSEGTLCTLTADVTTTQSFEFTRAVMNKKVFLLSSNLKPVPQGAIGEICLTGAGLASGYLKNETLTNLKFLPNSFEPKLSTRLYRTGDLGVETVNGGIQILGRNDLQVKVRGIRVEVGEVESEFLKIKGITRSAVIWEESTDGHQLIGFYGTTETEGTDPIQVDDVRQLLKLNLPEYMVPSQIFALKTFPLTPNGKINRAELFKLIPTRSAESSRVPPKDSEILDDLALIRIWEEVLCLPPNSVEKSSNFFSLGGNSLLAIKVLNVIFSRFGIQPNATKIMENGGSFESFLIIEETNAEHPKSTATEIPSRTTNENLPLSTTQERIRLRGQHWVNHFVVDVVFETIDPEPILTRLKFLLMRHEILRTIYPTTRFGTLVQKVLENPDLPVKILQSNVTHEFIREEFDLSTQLPIRVALVPEVKHILIVVHSIAMDFQGQELFLQELTRESQLVPNQNPVSYADYSVFQRNYIPGSEVKGLVAFWQEVMDQPPIMSLRRIPSKEIQTAEIRLNLPQFQILAQYLGVSLYDLFLTAQVLAQLALDPDEEEVTIGTFISLRDHPQLFDIIGNLTQVVPLTFDLDSIDLHKVSQVVAKGVKRAKVNQSFPMDMAVMAAGSVKTFIERDLFRFLYDFRVTTAFNKENDFDLDGVKGRIYRVERAWPFLPATEVLTTVDLLEGIVQIGFRGWNNLVVSQMKVEFSKILDKLSLINKQ